MSNDDARATDIARSYMRTFMRAKQKLVTTHGVGTDLPNSMLVIRDTQPFLFAHISAHADERLAAKVSAVVACTGGDLVLLIVETYQRRVDQVVSDVDREKAIAEDAELDYAQLFADGDPDIAEALLVAHIAPDGTAGAWSATYTYDGTTIRWGEPHHASGNFDGLFVDAVARGFAEHEAERLAGGMYLAGWPTSTQCASVLAELGVRTAVPMRADVGVN